MKRRLLWAILVGLGALALVRLVWLREYPVRSGSMEPTILGSEDGGELVLVAFGGDPEPQRFDLVVARVAGHQDPLVKRVVALPGESVEIRNGDLWIDGAILPPDAPRPAPVLVFDDRWLDLDEWFRRGSSDLDPWRRDGEEWELDAHEVPAGSNGGMMFLARELRDGYLTPQGLSVPGDAKVDDAIVAFDFRLEDPPAVVRAGLHEKGDVFEVLVEPRPAGRAVARLVRRSPSHPLQELGATELELARDAWHSLGFSNVDDALRVLLDGRELLSATYEQNVPHPTESLRGTILWQSYGHRVSFGGEQGRARFRRVRIWRDFQYTDQGQFAVREPLQLGANEVFLLGDHSSHSADGRLWGPTALDAIVGRPIAVIWPPSHARLLRGTAPGPLAPVPVGTTAVEPAR